MQILVTGGAGFVGTALIPLLLDHGHRVRVLDNLMYSGDPLLPFFRRPNFEFYKGDIRDAEDVKRAAAGCDAVIHLAAIVGYPACRKEPALAEAVNVQGTRNVIAAVSGEQIVLYGSTGSNYGAVEEICTEETPLNPLSLYGQTKTLAEKMLLEERPTIAYRFATAFGVSGRIRLDLLINDFTFKALTQGYLVVYESHFMRTFIHVHDMARAFLFALEHAAAMKGNVYNIGSDQLNYSKKEICSMICEQIPCYVNYADVGEDADKRNYVVSYKKINALGYRATITAPQGIAELKRALEVVSFRTPYTNV